MSDRLAPSQIVFEFHHYVFNKAVEFVSKHSEVRSCGSRYHLFDAGAEESLSGSSENMKSSASSSSLSSLLQPNFERETDPCNK